MYGNRMTGHEVTKTQRSTKGLDAVIGEYTFVNFVPSRLRGKKRCDVVVRKPDDRPRNHEAPKEHEGLRCSYR